MLVDLTFSITAFFKLLLLLPERKFDFVVTVVPSFQFGLIGIFYKKLKNTRLLYHIHDMQIEAARDLKMIKSDKFINALFKVEKYIIEQCDDITCVGEGMVRKTQVKTDKEVALFPNWVDTSQFYPLTDKAALKEEIGFLATDKIILYSGAIGEKQGLHVILEAAKALERHQNWKFLICGSGPYKEKLKGMAEELDITNVIFCPLQPIETFNKFMNAADVHLVVQKVSACDLVMPSKLITILAVGGLALVTANSGSGLHSVVDRHNIGLLVEAENTEALIEGIRKAVEEDNEKIKKNARFFAEVFLSVDGIMGSFESKYILQEVPETLKKTEHLPQPLPSYNLDRSALKRVNERLADTNPDGVRSKIV
ncbi:group 1 glycosyl transferase [Flammeovirgaceae bacterium 311]|nr:group 1 glycosyl transferase [Flammeovirgaceae bacterium 311]